MLPALTISKAKYSIGNGRIGIFRIMVLPPACSIGSQRSTAQPTPSLRPGSLGAPPIRVGRDRPPAWLARATQFTMMPGLFRPDTHAWRGDVRATCKPENGRAHV